MSYCGQMFHYTGFFVFLQRIFGFLQRKLKFLFLLLVRGLGISRLA
jgi:hypothetical protein